ncbi:MAG: CPBP family intramembrane metalloprotease [Clostridium sp.]|nr:CPBP family intramembrane metalloprotease [Clostridium sp.]
MACLIGPICEEVLYRGIALNLFEKYSNYKWGIILSSLCFSIGHFSVASIFIFPAFIVTGYIYYKKKNIIYPIIFHVTNNLLAYFFQKSGVLSPGKNILHFTIIGIILIILGGVMLFYKNKRNEAND